MFLGKRIVYDYWLVKEMENYKKIFIYVMISMLFVILIKLCLFKRKGMKLNLVNRKCENRSNEYRS